MLIRLVDLLLARYSTRFAAVKQERDELREWQREASGTLHALYRREQAWKARAVTAESRLARVMRSGHPSCRTVMPDEQIEAFDEWVASLPVKED